jgi:hypothetical protein
MIGDRGTCGASLALPPLRCPPLRWPSLSSARFWGWTAMSRRAWWLAGGLVLAYLGLTAWAWSGAAAVLTAESDRRYPDAWLDFSGVLEASNGGVVTPVLHAGIHSPVVIAGGQVFIFAAASSLFAIATIHRLRGQWTGWVLAVLVLALSLLPVFWSSHLALASQSLMFTSETLWLASVVWLCSARRGEMRPLIANATAIALLALVHPGAMLAILPAQFVLLAWWGRQERSGRAAFAAMMSMIPFAVFAGIRVWQIADRDEWPLAALVANLVNGDDSFRDYALAWTSVSNAPALSELRLMTWTDDSVLPRAFDDLLMPGASPWILLAACLAVGLILALVAGVRLRVTLAGFLGLVLALAPLTAFAYAAWAASGNDIAISALAFLPLAAIAALVLPATIPHRPERPERARRAALAEVTSRWVSPGAPVERAVS